MKLIVAALLLLPCLGHARVQTQEDVIAGNYNDALYLMQTECSDGSRAKVQRGIEYKVVTLYRSGTYRVQTKLRSKNDCTVDELGQYLRIADSTQIKFQPTNKVRRCNKTKSIDSLKVTASYVVGVAEDEEELDLYYINELNARFCPKGEVRIERYLVYNDKNP